MPPQTDNFSFAQMDINDPREGIIPGCLGWLQMSRVDTNPAGGAASIDYYFYKDIPHWQTGTNPVAILTDALSGAEVLAVASSVPTPGLTLAAYAFASYLAIAKTHLTVPAKNPDGTPQVDANNQPVMISAFAGASVVSVPVTVTVP